MERKDRPLPPPRRSRRAAMAETRAALIRAGLSEFAVHGLDAPSLDRICTRAGYTRGAFYVHFASREEFIVAVIEARLEAFLRAAVAGIDRDADLEAVSRRFQRALAAAPHGVPAAEARSSREPMLQLHRVLEASQRFAAVRDRVGTLLESGRQRLVDLVRLEQDRGRLRGDVAAESVATLLLSLALGAASAQEAGFFPSPAPAAADLLRLLRSR